MAFSNFHFQIQILLLISKNTDALDFDGIKDNLAPALTDHDLLGYLNELLLWGWVESQNGLYKISEAAFKTLGEIRKC